LNCLCGGAPELSLACGELCRCRLHNLWWKGQAQLLCSFLVQHNLFDSDFFERDLLRLFALQDPGGDLPTCLSSFVPAKADARNGPAIGEFRVVDDERELRRSRSLYNSVKALQGRVVSCYP